MPADWSGGFPFGGNLIPPLSHGYVHEPFPGAWQQNAECFGPWGIFSAVYACIQTIAGDVAKLPPLIYRQNPDGSRDEYPNHPAQRVLYEPNAYQTGVDFWGQFMASSLFTGNAYALLVRDERNVIAAMHLLNPRTTSPMLAVDGSVWYRVGVNALARPEAVSEIEADGSFYLPARMVMHHRLLCLTHPLIGVSPIYAAGMSAQTGQTIQSNAYNFFSNMSRTSGVLTAPGKISSELATRLKTEWEQNFKGGSMGRVAVLGEGLKWEALSLTAADAQLIEQLRWSVEDVARCFRVPLYMVSDAGKISHKNTEQLNRGYYTQTLQYHLESIERRIDRTFDLAPRSIYCEFDLSSLLRMEFDSRMSAYQTGINSGVLAINEVRKLEQLPPVKGGDEPLVQVQYVPLSMAGNNAGAPVAPAPSEPAANDDGTADDGTADDGSADTTDEPPADEAQLAALELRLRALSSARLALPVGATA